MYNQNTQKIMGKRPYKIDLRNTNLIVKGNSLSHEIHAKIKKRILINRLIKKDLHIQKKESKCENCTCFLRISFVSGGIFSLKG
jgi:hypothetical protein